MKPWRVMYLWCGKFDGFRVDMVRDGQTVYVTEDDVFVLDVIESGYAMRWRRLSMIDLSDLELV